MSKDPPYPQLSDQGTAMVSAEVPGTQSWQLPNLHRDSRGLTLWMFSPPWDFERQYHLLCTG